MKRTIRVGVLVMALAGVACGEEPAEPVAPTPAPEPAAPEPAPEPEPEPEAPVAATETTLPVAEDFEVEMSASVTAENYRAELDAVIAELDAQ